MVPPVPREVNCTFYHDLGLFKVGVVGADGLRFLAVFGTV